MKVRIYPREYRPDGAFVDFGDIDEVEHSSDEQNGFYARLLDEDDSPRRVLWVNDDAVLAVEVEIEREAEE